MYSLMLSTYLWSVSLKIWNVVLHLMDNWPESGQTFYHLWKKFHSGPTPYHLCGFWRMVAGNKACKLRSQGNRFPGCAAHMRLHILISLCVHLLRGKINFWFWTWSWNSFCSPAKRMLYGWLASTEKVGPCTLGSIAIALSHAQECLGFLAQCLQDKSTTGCIWERALKCVTEIAMDASWVCAELFSLPICWYFQTRCAWPIAHLLKDTNTRIIGQHLGPASTWAYVSNSDCRHLIAFSGRK